MNLPGRGRSVKLIVQYDGTEYHGFCRQKSQTTIQGELERSLKKLLGESITVAGAGRTDAGTHALGQVVNFKTSSKLPIERLSQALNTCLPEDIRVIEAGEAFAGFEARKSAQSKRYVYTIFCGEQIPFYLRRFAFHERQALNTAKMKKVLSLIEGEHDFKAFSVEGGSSKTSVRRIFEAKLEVSRQGEWGKLLKFTFVGNGFLYKMVRRLMAFVRAVGLGKIEPEQVLTVFETREKKLVPGTMSAHGLCLEQVIY